MLRSLCCVAALAAVSPALAQTTWIVDAANGPGTNFTDLPPALAVAQADDTVLVRSGVYHGGATTAGIRLRFEAGAYLGIDETVTVHDLPANERFLVRNLTRVIGTISKPIFVAQRCQGAVVVEGLLSGVLGGASVNLEDCAQASLASCTVVSEQAVTCVRSQVSITNSSLSVSLLSPSLGQPTCLVQDGTLILGETEVIGVNSTYLNPPGVGVGVRADHSVLIVTGSGAKKISQGSMCKPYPMGCTPPGPAGPPAIDNISSLVVVDPRIPLIGAAPGAIRLGIPALIAAGAPLDGMLRTMLWPHTQGTVALVASVPSAPVSTPFGPLWAGLGNAVLYLQPAATNVAIPFDTRVGPGLYPYERSLTLQAAELDLQGNLTLSNPAAVVLL